MAVFSDMQEKAWTRFTFNIWAIQNPPSPNELLSKGYRLADIKASAHASHKTYACISLKQRGYSHNYGLVCNLGKQMAVLSGKAKHLSKHHVHTRNLQLFRNFLYEFY